VVVAEFEPSVNGWLEAEEPPSSDLAPLDLPDIK
jgi:hypothetical protein